MLYNIYNISQGIYISLRCYLLFSTAMLPPSPSLSSDTVLLCSQHLSSAVEGFSSSVSPLPLPPLSRSVMSVAEIFSVCHQSGLVLFTALLVHGHMAFFLLSITLYCTCNIP